MSCQEMYRLPVINVPVPTNELNLPIGSEKGFMYKLPKIQGTLLDENQPDILKQLEARQDSILKQLECLKQRVASLKGNSNNRKNVSNVIHGYYSIEIFLPPPRANNCPLLFHMLI